MRVPVKFKTIEADHVLQIHQNHYQRVQLVSQPEVCKANTVKRSRHHSKLQIKTEMGFKLLFIYFVTSTYSDIVLNQFDLQKCRKSGHP